MKRFRKSVIMPLALFIYTTVMAIYFIPRNHELSDTEKWVTVSASYLIIVLLWWVLRKKEQMMAKREEEAKRNDKK
ncbi:MAG: hypothetical protein J6K05_06495 [Bacteroidaceae bacterium]|nr:hypothetical protein [Bacteroidaceae bacterium]MBR3757669.1 hypothetical protein [Bacteroidaceae bacterium]